MTAALSCYLPDITVELEEKDFIMVNSWAPQQSVLSLHEPPTRGEVSAGTYWNPCWDL